MMALLIVLVWSVVEGQEISYQDLPDGAVLRLAEEDELFSGDYFSGRLEFSPDSNILALEYGDRIRFLDVKFRQFIKFDNDRLNHTMEFLYRMEFSPDGRTFATAQINSPVTLWDYKGDRVAKLSPFPYYPTEFEFSPDGRFLATGTECLSWEVEAQETCRNLYIYDVPKRSLVHIFEGEEYGGITSIAFSPDGNTLAAVRQGVGRKCHLWNTSTWALEDSVNGIEILGFSPDSRILVTKYNRDAWLWDMSTGDNIARLDGYRPEGYEYTPDVGRSLFSENGEILACASGGAVLLWDVDSLTIQDTLLTNDQIRSLEIFSNIFVTNSGYESKVHFWNMSGDIILTIDGHSDWLNGGLAVSPNDEILVTNSYDGTILLWDIPYLMEVRPRLFADFDRNGIVDLKDFFLLADSFGTDEPLYDLDTDGIVGMGDFFIFADHFGQGS